MLIKVFLPVIAVWYAITWAFTFEDFKEESDSYNVINGKVACWIAFTIYPIVIIPVLLYSMVANFVKLICWLFAYPFNRNSTKYSGKSFLAQEKYRDSKRKRGRKEFNHPGRR